MSDILDLAKVEAGKMVLDIRDLDIGETVGNALMLSSRSAEAKRIELVSRLPEPPLRIQADARACKQIVLNLVSNAVKFCREGGRVEVSVEDQGEFVCLTVRDNGIGIPADVLPSWARPLNRRPTIPCWRAKAPGSGLALVRNLAAAHGGSLHIDSIQDTGTYRHGASCRCATGLNKPPDKQSGTEQKRLPCFGHRVLCIANLVSLACPS